MCADQNKTGTGDFIPIRVISVLCDQIPRPNWFHALWYVQEAQENLQEAGTFMQPLELRNHILRLAIPAPLTDPYERQWRARKRKKVWYSSQKEHWLGWLQEYDGPGYYGRTIRVRTAEYCFNHIQCPPMLLWLGEACGLPRPVILSALAVCGMIDGHQAQCQMVRQHISWCRVHDRLVK